MSHSGTQISGKGSLHASWPVGPRLPPQIAQAQPDLHVCRSVDPSSIEPTPDITITANDFYFDLSKPITAGPHTIQVTNGGSQAHEVVLVKLASGATVKEFLAAVEPGAAGPPPGRPLGGIVGLDREGRGYFTSTFEPGRYALICFFPDVKTGTPHFSHGMTREFTVD